jgi:hypothetical protein
MVSIMSPGRWYVGPVVFDVHVVGSVGMGVIVRGVWGGIVSGLLI